MAKTTHRAWRWERFRKQWDPFFNAFCSIRRPYITFKLPCGDMDTPPRLLNFFRDVSFPLSLEWPVWSSSSGNNYHAVHRSLSSGGSHFFFTAQWEFLLPCLLLWAKLYFTSSYNLFVLIYCIRILCDWSFRPCHNITDISYFASIYLFFIWSNWSLWRYFVLL